MPQDGDEAFVADIINCSGTQNVLPVVYLSCSNSSRKPVLDADILAKKLGGVAHVIVEPNTHFSRELKEQLKLKEAACYDGGIRVYWPKVSNPRLNRLWFREVLESANQGSFRGRDFTEEIAAYVLSRMKSMELGDCSFQRISFYSGMQRIKASLQKFKKEETSHNELSAIYDSITKQNEQEIIRLNGVNGHLEKTIRTMADEMETLRDDYEAAQLNLREIRASTSGSDAPKEASGDDILIALKAFVEKNEPSPYYAGVIRNFLNVRAKQLEQALKTANAAVVEIGNAFNGYTRLNAHQVKVLSKYGFYYTEDGAHYKIMKTGFNPDIFVTLAKTPGDYRSGRNFITDMTATFFRV
jgi:hypothetical protein